MSNGIIAFLISVGFATWVYAKFQRQTGNNTQTSLIAAGASALVVFLILWSLLNMIPS